MSDRSRRYILNFSNGDSRSRQQKHSNGNVTLKPNQLTTNVMSTRKRHVKKSPNNWPKRHSVFTKPNHPVMTVNTAYLENEIRCLSAKTNICSAGKIHSNAPSTPGSQKLSEGKCLSEQRSVSDSTLRCEAGHGSQRSYKSTSRAKKDMGGQTRGPRIDADAMLVTSISSGCVRSSTTESSANVVNIFENRCAAKTSSSECHSYRKSKSKSGTKHNACGNYRNNCCSNNYLDEQISKNAVTQCVSRQDGFFKKLWRACCPCC